MIKVRQVKKSELESSITDLTQEARDKRLELIKTCAISTCNGKQSRYIVFDEDHINNPNAQPQFLCDDCMREFRSQQQSIYRNYPFIIKYDDAPDELYVISFFIRSYANDRKRMKASNKSASFLQALDKKKERVFN